jgi:YVTN family beta-propeller protein
VGLGPAEVAFDGAHIWVTNISSNTVTKLDTAGNVVATYSVGANPLGIAFDGTHIWVTNYGSNSVQRL